MNNLRKKFTICREKCFKVKVHAKKITVFAKLASFCGEIIDREGVRYDPRSLSSVIDIS